MKLRELFEASTSKHITFCFGRMNPPTIGHAKLFETMQGVGGDFKIFVSQSQDKKENPLSYGEKIKFIKAIHPQYAKNIVEDTSLNTIGKVCSYLYEQGYRNATFVAGSDRLPAFQKLIGDYNGVEGKAHGFYKFEVLDFVSAGARDPDSPGVEGVSASKARAEAANGDIKGFEAATGAGQYTKPMFDAVRKGMGFKEEVGEARMSAQVKLQRAWEREQAKSAASRKRGQELLNPPKKEEPKKEVEEHIVKVKGGYELKSKHGNKNLGKYPTKAGAEKRERQVQYFKHAGK